MSKNQNCLNCNAPVLEQFCGQCGQKQDLKFRYQSIWFLITNGVKQLLFLDNKFFKTFRVLLFKPGELTIAYMEGKLKTYLNPITIFLLALLFSALLNVNPLSNDIKSSRNNWEYFDQLVHEKLADSTYDKSYLEGVYSARSNSFGKVSYLLLVLILGSLFSLIFFKKKLPFTHHLVFWLHLISVISLIFLPIIFKFNFLPGIRTSGGSMNAEVIPFLIVGMTYITFALNRAYNIKYIWSALLSFPFFILYLAGVMLFQPVNFFLTMLSI